VVISAGIRPRDELARACGLDVAPRGGIAINGDCRTSDESIYAIGECAAYEGRVFGLVAPGYQMARIAAARVLGTEGEVFAGADMSTKLKLLGVEVATGQFAAGLEDCLGPLSPLSHSISLSSGFSLSNRPLSRISLSPPALPGSASR
jgi:NAD(P)H-nitrite reductase large subunit